MPQIDRNTFVFLCNQVIEKTRKDITITNHLDGYIKYHKEIRDNAYIKTVLYPQLEQYPLESSITGYKLIQHAGVGNCSEIAQYLCTELLIALREYQVDALVMIVSSLITDHALTEVKIQLLHEKFPSFWVVDAWDPRVIDFSRRKDGTYKNEEALEYGEHQAAIRYTFHTSSKILSKSYKFSFFRQPEEGPPSDCPTPEREMTEKNEFLYSNHPIEDAYKNGKLCPPNELGYLQKASNWQ